MNARKNNTYKELTLSFHDAETDNSSDEETTSQFENAKSEDARSKKAKSDPNSLTHKSTSRLQQKILEISSLFYVLTASDYDCDESAHSKLLESGNKMLNILKGVKAVSNVNVSKLATIEPSTPAQYFEAFDSFDTNELAIADFGFTNFSEDEIGNDLVFLITMYMEISRLGYEMMTRLASDECRQMGLRAHSMFAASQVRYEAEQTEKATNSNVSSLRQ